MTTTPNSRETPLSRDFSGLGTTNADFNPNLAATDASTPERSRGQQRPANYGEPDMAKWLSQAVIAMAMTAPVMASADGYPIGGTTPYQRPAGAPVITVVNHDGSWYQQALTGVVPPYPASLRFLENQGNWYTPFNHAGASAPYDLRGWHH